MKKEKSDLEQLLSKLLNDLLRMWRKPFNRDKTLHIDCYDKCKWLNYKWVHLDGWFMNEENRTLRELVSVDSGLWQFVCKNKLFPKNRWHKRENDLWCGVKFYEDEPEYYIIECALLEEWEIEDFLIKNIKVEWH